jgi:dihydrofolate reductase
VTPRPAVVLYIAARLDGYIASADGGIDWLKPFEAEDYGYGEFIAGIGTIVMGRRTYDQLRGFADWPYAGKRVVVLTSRPLEAAPEGVEASAEPVAALLARLGAMEARGETWLCGGGDVIAQFLAEDLIDRLELFIVPVLLGEGVPLFPEGAWRSLFSLQGVQAYASGVAGLSYVRLHVEPPRREQPEEPDEPII